MTAFARAAVTLPQGTLGWEIRSVNSKGLDLRLRLPAGFDAEEAAFRASIGAVVTRGTVHATMTIQRVSTAPEVRIDTTLLRRLAEAAREAGSAGLEIAPPTMDGLLTVRGVVEVVERAETAEERGALASAAHAQLSRALSELEEGRQAEGRALGEVLGQHLGALAALVQAAVEAPGRRPEAVRARLRAVVAALTDTTLDPERLYAEAVLMAARADVSEEIDRLRMHLEAARKLMNGGGAVGRRLDFLAQELAREANTLCAKSADAELTAIGLDLRTRIEQFREQVQNLE